MRLDDGRVVKATPTGKYEEWQRKTHKRIGSVGENEEELARQGSIEVTPFKNGLPTINGRVIAGRLVRSSMLLVSKRELISIFLVCCSLFFLSSFFLLSLFFLSSFFLLSFFVCVRFC